jgi:hypothetical protein
MNFLSINKKEISKGDKMYRKIMVIMAMLLLTSCINSPTITRGGSSSGYATRDAEVVFGDEQTYPRIALVMGNNNYQKNRRLTNAVPDARAMRDFFQNRGFQVVYAENADKDTMNSKINEFMGGLGKKSVSVIYYSGHASQDKSRKTGVTTNYLLPINDRSLTSVTDYDRDAISLNYILNKADELNHGLNIAMLDACRTPIGRGGNIQNIGAEGVYLVYSTASGVTASDSGAFRRSFLKYAKQPLKLTDIFGGVKLDLRKEGQRPSVQNDKVGIFYFSKPSSKPTTVQPTPTISTSSKWMKNTGERAKWKKAKEICRAKGGRLPTKEELRKVITDCGGEMKDDNSAEWKRNRKNSSYQSCYKAKGFTSNYYWSSTTYASDSSYAWLVFFDGGYDGWDDKTYEGSVRCVRGGH